MSQPSWNEFEQRPTAAPRNLATDNFAELCATVFTTPSGRELMKLIREQTIETRTRVGAPDAAYREDEAVRFFVATLERSRDRGLELMAAKARSKT